MNLQDFTTLQAAIDYVAPKERMISQDMIVSFLTLNDCVTSLQTSTNEKAKGFYLAITSGVQEFNLMNSHAVGQSQQALLAYLVTVGAVNQAFADACVGYANGTYQPFVNATAYEFARAKKTIPYIVKNPIEGYVKLTNNTADEFLAIFYTEIQGVKVRSGSVTINGAGDYLIKTNQQIFIENYYDSLA